MADRFFETFVAALAARQPTATIAVAPPPGRLALLWRFLKRLFGAH
jgi:hypothetical protein